MRDIAAASRLLEDAVMKGFLTANDAKRIQMVALDLEDPLTLPLALEGVTGVVCAAACPESGVLDPTGPKRIDGDGTIALISASKATESVKQFILITSLGTGKFGLPGTIFTKAF